MRELEPESVTRAQFALGCLEAKLDAIRSEVLDGRGVVILSGIPVERYSARDMQHVVWGLGLYLGVAVFAESAR